MFYKLYCSPGFQVYKWHPVPQPQPYARKVYIAGTVELISRNLQRKFARRTLQRYSRGFSNPFPFLWKTRNSTVWEVLAKFLSVCIEQRHGQISP